MLCPGCGQECAYYHSYADELPAELSAVNLKAWFFYAFGLCGCMGLSLVHDEVVAFLEWVEATEHQPGYERLFAGNVGVFYLIAGQFDKLKLIEHGTSARHPFLTQDGKRLLFHLGEHSGDDVDGATGVAYDGCEYGLGD